MIYTPFIWPLLIAILINAALAIYVRRYLGVPGAVQLSRLLWLGTLVAAIYLLEISVRSLSLEIFLSEARLAVLAFITPTELALILAYLGYSDRLSRTHWIALLCIPTLTALLSLTGNYQNLFRYNFQHASESVSFLVFERGLFWYLYYGYTLAIIAAGCTLLVRSFHKEKVQSHASQTILAALLLPLIIDFLYVLGLTPSHGFYWTPAVFSISGIFIAWALLRGRLFDFHPIARDKVLENIDDLVIVLDLEDHIVDFNHAAQATCGLSNASIGSLPGRAMPPEWVAILGKTGQAGSLDYQQADETQAAGSQSKREEICLSLPEDTGTPAHARYYEVTRSPIMDRRRWKRNGLWQRSKLRQLGTLFLFHDITARKQLHRELLEARDQLEQHVQERTSELLEANFLLQQEIDERKQAEEALRESEQRFRVITSSTPDHIVVQDQQLRYTQVVNPQLGLTEADMLGKTDADFLAPEDARRLTQAKQQVLKTGHPLQYTTSLTSRAGNPEYFDGTYVPKFDAQGQVDGLIGYFRNVTEQKLAEQALHDSELANLEALEFNKKILSTSSIGILTYHESGPCTFANQAAADIAGTEVEGLLEQNFHQIHSWQVYGIYEAALEALKTGQEQQFEVESRTTFGRDIWTNFSFSSFFLLGEKHLLVFLQDITKRKQAEQALWASEEKYRRLVETAHEGIVMLDAQHRISYINQQITQMTGYQPEQVVGQLGISFVFPEDEAEQGIMLDERARGLAGRYERKLRHADGHTVWLAVSSSPLRGEDGGFNGSFSMVSDITKRREAEQSLRESEERFRELAETTSTAILVFQGEHFCYLNPACERISGYSQSELLTMKFWELASLESQEDIRQRGLMSQRGEEIPQRQELKLIRKDGAELWMDYTATLITWDGSPAVLGTALDITERKQIEAAEREQRQMAEALHDSSVALTRSLDLDQVLDQVIASVGLVVTSDSVSFLLVESREPGNTQVKIARQRGFAPDEPGESLLGIRLTLEQTANIRWMAETGKSLVIDQVRSYPGWVDLPQGRWIRSIVGAPVRIKDETIGFIVLASATPAFFTSEHAKRLEVFAAQAAIAIDNARLYEEVLAGRERLQAISVRLVQVQESERRRLARELHDEIGQALTGLKFSLEIGTGELDLGAGPPDMLRTRLWQASQQVSELIAKTRELSLALRPAMLDDLGLLPALIWQIDRYQEQTGIRVQFQASDLEGRRFPAELETAAYRIVQEALTNVARHAQVRQAAVRIWVKAAARRGESQAGSGDIKTYSSTDPGCKLIVSVEDHGAGFDLPAVLASRDGGGLAGMQERAALLGGRLTIEALPGTGTHLTAMLPI